MAGNQSSKGIPTKSRSASRKARRIKNLATQPWKKLRHILKRNGVRPAFEWATAHSNLNILKQLRPDYSKELQGTLHGGEQ